MNIGWIKCSDLMPPDDDRMIICRYGGGIIDKMRAEVFHRACKFSQKVNGNTNIIWAEFTKEKWEFLNKLN